MIMFEFNTSARLLSTIKNIMLSAGIIYEVI